MKLLRYNTLRKFADILIDYPINYYHLSGVMFPQERSDLVCESSLWPKYSSVFIKTDLLAEKLNWLKEIKNPFHLLTGSSDICINDNPNLVNEIIKNTNVCSWCGTNLVDEHPKMLSVPIGFEEYERSGREQIFNFFSDNEKPIKKYEILITYLSNTSKKRMELHELTNYDSRKRIFQQHFKLELKEYLKQLAESIFVICPEGNGYDTLRIYETILSGSIPIVKVNPLWRLHREMGCIIVDDWKQVLDISNHITNQRSKELILTENYWKEKIDGHQFQLSYMF